MTVDSIEGDGPVRVRARAADGAAFGRRRALRRSTRAASRRSSGDGEGLREYNEFFKNLAIFGYFADAERLPGELRNHILSAAHQRRVVLVHPAARRDDERRRGRRCVALEGTSAAGNARRDLSVARGALSTRYRASAGRTPGRARSRHSRLFVFEPPLLSRARPCSRATPRASSIRYSLPAFISRYSPGCSPPIRSRTCSRAGVAPSTAFADYDVAYRRAFERYRRFVTFFYNHHADPDSYFWQARKLVDSRGGLELREAFVRLIAGTGDLPDGADGIRQIDDRWSASLATAEARTAPGMHLLRVAATLAEMRRLTEKSRPR